MSRLTQARGGIPDARKKSKFKRFRRTHWLVGNVEQRRAHDGLTPLTRTWREGEPVVKCKRTHP